MTPLIKQACKWVEDPAMTHWFDVGQMPGYTPDGLALDPEMLVHLPYRHCTLVGKDADGDVFLLTLISETAKSVAVAGLTRTARGMVEMPPFAYLLVEDGLALHRCEDEDAARRAVSIIQVWIDRIEASGGQALQAVAKAHPMNAERVRKGKAPLFFDWRTLVIAPRAQSHGDAKGTHASPRAHERRGHWRRLPSGVSVWVRECRVGDASVGMVFKDYRVAGNAPEESNESA